jgi:hypothetical protein
VAVQTVQNKRSPSFRSFYNKLNPDQKNLADEAYRRFRQNPDLVWFKPLKQGKTLHSARVGKDGRAIASVRPGIIDWLWVGFGHQDYDRAIDKLEAKGY